MVMSWRHNHLTGNLMRTLRYFDFTLLVLNSQSRLLQNFLKRFHYLLEHNFLGTKKYWNHDEKFCKIKKCDIVNAMQYAVASERFHQTSRVANYPHFIS